MRPLEIDDTPDLFVILSDEESVRYWSHEAVKDHDEVRKILTTDIESDAQGNSICWAATLKDKPEKDKPGKDRPGKDRPGLIGKFILFQFDQPNHRAEIGFILNRDYWRSGLSFQALQAIINFAFDELDLHRIEADVDPANPGSLAILDKLGFKREGLFRDRWKVNKQWVDSVMLGLLRDEWQHSPD